jgi:hypothetical protein
MEPPQGTYVGNIQLGTFQKIPMPNAATLKTYTQQTISNTFTEKTKKIDSNPLPIDPSAGNSPIKHIVYITKENRTYDEIFGQLKTGKGDSTFSVLSRIGPCNREEPPWISSLVYFESSPSCTHCDPCTRSRDGQIVIIFCSMHVIQ